MFQFKVIGNKLLSAVHREIVKTILADTSEQKNCDSNFKNSIVVDMTESLIYSTNKLFEGKDEKILKTLNIFLILIVLYLNLKLLYNCLIKLKTT